MSRPRVVVTGIGLCSPIGNSPERVVESLQNLEHGIVILPEWGEIDRLNTRLAAPVNGISRQDFPRKAVRTMGRVAILAAWASDRAVASAGLDADYLSSGAVGLAYGSTHGSSSSLAEFCNTIFSRQSLAGLDGSAYLKFMSHTCPANLPPITRFEAVSSQHAPPASAQLKPSAMHMKLSEMESKKPCSVEEQRNCISPMPASLTSCMRHRRNSMIHLI